MSAYTTAVRPNFNAVAGTTEDLEKRGLENIKRMKEGGDDDLDDEIDSMCDDAKESNNREIDNLRLKLKEVRPDSAAEIPLFRKWLNDQAKPMLKKVIELIKDLGDLLRKTAVAIVKNIKNAAKAIASFFTTRVGRVARFVGERW